MKEVLFFANGLTAVFEDGVQIADLQVSWFALYLGELAARGILPSEATFTMPDGNHAIVSVPICGQPNWKIVEVE